MEETKKKKIGLIDGDLLIFSICAAVEYGQEPQDVDFNQIGMSIDSKLAFLKSYLEFDEMRVFLSGKNNLRFKIMPEYKANRATVWRPFHLKNAQAHVRCFWDAETVDGLEADDLMALHQKPDGSTTIVTLDKDLLQISGQHYRWETQHQGEVHTFVEGSGKLWIHEKPKKKEVKGNGLRFFLWQLLVGDPTDGIMGCGSMQDCVYKTGVKAGQAYQKRVGVGAIGAYKILEHCVQYKTGLAKVIEQYKKFFGDKWEEEILKQGRCLWMARGMRDGLVPLWHWNPSIKDMFDLEAQEIIKFEG